MDRKVRIQQIILRFRRTCAPVVKRQSLPDFAILSIDKALLNARRMLARKLVLTPTLLRARCNSNLLSVFEPIWFVGF